MHFRRSLAVLTVFLFGIFPSIFPGNSWTPPAEAATVGSGVCQQTVGSATNVTVAIFENDCVVTLANPGTTTWTVPEGATRVSVLLVGGGGSGGFGTSYSTAGGGGGGGGVSYTTLDSLSGTLTLTVGAGGSGSDASSRTWGSSGGPSLIKNSSNTTLAEVAGGSVGGRGQYSSNGNGGTGGASGTPTSFSGGSGSSGVPGTNCYGSSGGGGGGASEAGTNRDCWSNATGGAGGDGLTSTITGTAIVYGGGGGGGSDNTSSEAQGGSGGGGNGGSNDTSPTPGTGNTGGGGGGGKQGTYSGSDGAAGGSGVIIIRYSPRFLMWLDGASDTGSTTLLDATPNNYDAALMNSLTTTGDVYDFDNGTVTSLGLSDPRGKYIDAPDIPDSISFSEGLSIHVYADFDGVNQWERLIDFGNRDDDSNILFGRRSTTNDLIFQIYNNSPDDFDECIAEGAIDVDPHLYSLVLDGTNCKIYKDGTLLSTTAFTLDPESVTRTRNYIGESNWFTYGSDQAFDGEIGSVRIYNAAVAPKELQSTLTVSATTLLEGQESTLSSSGGSGNGEVSYIVESGNCTISGTTLTSTGSANDTCVVRGIKAATTQYFSATDVISVTVYPNTKSDQTITFDVISGKTYGDNPFTVTPTTDATGLTVSLASTTTSVCTVSSFTVTIESIGTCSLTASQAGNGFFNAATDVTRSFVVSPKAITMSIQIDDKTYDGSTTATVSSTSLIGLVTGDEDLVAVDEDQISAAFTNSSAGETKSVNATLGVNVLVAGPSGDLADHYTVTVASAPTGTITKASQSSLTISVNDSSLNYGDVAALSSSGGSGTGAVTFSVDSGDCSISGTTVTATGGTTDCVISAVKASDTNYLQASSSNTVTIAISKAAQTITFGGLSGKTYGAADFSVSATSSSGLPVSFTSNDADVCTVSGSTVSIVAVGTCSITANQAGNSLYSSASGVTQTFSVSAKAITVAVTVADKVYDAGTTATVSSGVLSGVVSGDTVSFVAANAAAAFGTAAVASGKSVTVTVDGDELSGADAGNYSLTVSGSPTASITKKPITVNVTPGGKTYDGTQSVASFSTSLSGVESGDTVSVDAGEVSVGFDAPGAGTQSATATVTSSVLTGADAGNYSASVGTVSSAVIAKASQATLSFTSASSVVFGQTLTLVATGGSGSGSITYGESGDCTISSGVITPTGAGSCSVTATRAADSNYLASHTASQTVTISQANQSINFTSTVPVSAVSGTTYTPTATASSGLTVSFSITTGDGTVCSLSSGVVTFAQSGTCVITAAQAGDTDYNAAASVTQTIVAGKINQTITFPSIAGKDFDDPAFAAGATVSSGRSVTFATSTGSVCAVNATSGVVSIQTVGDCTVTASSAGDPSYAAASDVSRTFTISPVLAGKPSVTSVSFGDSSVTVAFVAPGFVGGDAIDGYQVVATSSGGSVTKPDCSTTSPCTITGLTNGDAYTLTVAAINAAGVGPASTASPSITPARVADAVSGLATTPGDEQLAVSWTALTNDQVTAAGGTFTRYDVYLRVNGGAWGSAVNVTGQSSNSYTFTGLTNGTPYDVKVVAITNANSSELSSNTATALGVPATVPDAPTGLVVSSLSNTTALASWTAPADDGGDSISAYSVNLSCTFVNATDTFCTLSGLTAGARVTVTVGATNLMGTGPTVSYAITMPGGSSGSPGGSGSGSTATSAAEVPRGAAPLVVPRRIIVPVQPTPAPSVLSGPVVAPGRGFDPNVGTRATIGGAPATVSKRPLGNQGLSVQAGAFELGVMLSTPSSTGGVSSENPSNSPELSVPTGESTKVAGAGLLPGSSLQVWLPGRTGADARELARIPVSEDGTFDSELSFTAERSEVPIPIGRQVLQVTGYDEDGNQTVVDMTINIAQGSPQPEPNRAVGALPDLSRGQSLATSAGVPETVTIEVQPEQRSVAVLSGQWEFSVEVPEGSGDVGEAESGGSITLVQSTVARVSGDGFQPDTRVDIWLFSDPTLLGSVIVEADGSFTGEVLLDARFAIAGEHTLQLQGVAEDGFIKAANLGVEVQEPVELTTQSASGLVWWVAGGFLILLLVLFLVIAALRRRA